MPDKFNRNDPASAPPSDSGIDPGLAIGQRSPVSRPERGDEDLASSQRNPVAPRRTDAFKGVSDAEMREVEDDFSTSGDNE